MKQLTFFFFGLTCACWGQVETVKVEIDTPKAISVKLEAPPQTIWTHFLFPPLIAAIAAFSVGWWTNRINQQNNERQNKQDMLKWRADKQLEVLSRIGLLVVQTRHALSVDDNANEKSARIHAIESIGHAERIVYDDIARAAHQELARRREEFAALVGTAGFALSDTLWNQLQALERMFTEVCGKEFSAERRTSQLVDLDGKISEFNTEARLELESLRAARPIGLGPTRSSFAKWFSRRHD